MQKLQYKPVKSKRFGSDKETISVRTVSHGKINIADIKRVLGRSITGISSGMIDVVIEALQHILEEQLANGTTVDLGLFDVSLSIRGSLSSDDESIDIKSGKHSIKVIVRPTVRLLNFLKDNLEFEKDLNPNYSLVIQSFQNANTGSVDSFRPAQVCELKGYKMKLNKNSTEDGVYLVDFNSGVETKTQLIGQGTHRKLCFYVPENLPMGTYKVMIKSTITGSLKVGEYTQSITCTQ